MGKPDIFGQKMIIACGMAHRRIVCGMARRVRYCLSLETAWGMIVVCRMAGLRSRRGGWSSRGYGRCRIACRMAPSPDLVSSCPCPLWRPRCPCRAPGWASRRPVICHAPAQQRREPTPPAAVYERLFFCMAVAFYRGAFGGAAKANRWAARIP